MYAKLLRRTVDNINQGFAINNIQAKSLLAAYRDARNENCLKCGKYKTAHEGSCDGCKFKEG